MVKGFISLIAIYMLFIAFTTMRGDFEVEKESVSSRNRELCIGKIRTFSLNREDANSVCETIEVLKEGK